MYKKNYLTKNINCKRYLGRKLNLKFLLFFKSFVVKVQCYENIQFPIYFFFFYFFFTMNKNFVVFIRLNQNFKVKYVIAWDWMLKIFWIFRDDKILESLHIFSEINAIILWVEFFTCKFYFQTSELLFQSEYWNLLNKSTAKYWIFL